MLAAVGVAGWVLGEAGVVGAGSWVVAAGGASVLFGALLWNLRLRSTATCACGACRAVR